MTPHVTQLARFALADAKAPLVIIRHTERRKRLLGSQGKIAGGQRAD